MTRTRVTIANLARPCLPLTVAIGTVLLTGPTAAAEPADNAVPPGPPAVTAIPSTPPATTRTADGWTLTLSAGNETRMTPPPMNPESPPVDTFASAVFRGELRGPDGAITPTPAGTMEVGYELHCLATGMVAALKPSIVVVKVAEQEFTGANPTATVDQYSLHADCMGPTVVRSYAVLTRTTGTTASTVAYYGVPVPIANTPDPR